MKKATSDLLLLDVNVLLALAWPNHQFHSAALLRLEANDDTWATCALTELGFIRISSNAAVVGISKTPGETANLLAAMVRDRRHVYLDALPSPVSQAFLASWEENLSGKQVTDAYLLALARESGAKLLTFDTRMAMISPSARVEVLS